MILLAPKERNSFQAEYCGALQNYNGGHLEGYESYFAPLGLALRGGVTTGGDAPGYSILPLWGKGNDTERIPRLTFPLTLTLTLTPRSLRSRRPSPHGERE